MNTHFEPLRGPEESKKGDDFRLPRHAYGRVDHIERPAESAGSVLIAIDLVDADWLEEASRGDAKFDLANADLRYNAWKSFSEQFKAGERENPFANAPLFRLELEVQVGSDWLGFGPTPSPSMSSYVSWIQRMEGAWIEILDIARAAPSAPEAALLYSALFADPVPVNLKGKLPSAQEGKALSDIFCLDYLPKVGLADLQRVLEHSSAEMLAVYDVGQGNANALIGQRLPTLYFDLGAGVYRNKHTTPLGLRFCFTEDPIILLSHWDADHWAGAYATKVGSRYPALSHTWIAPCQEVGPVHVAFAYDIHANGGALFIYQDAPGVIGSAKMQNGCVARFVQGTGSGKNDSGIVLAIESTVDDSPVSWLLPGDCNYCHFVPSLNPSPPIAIVAPHHGAELHSPTSAPSPAASGVASRYRRLVYSFGRDNAHGKAGVRHPTAAGVAVHTAAGWNHAAWPGEPGAPFPNMGSEVLATCEHGPGLSRNGLLIGWTSAPTIFGIPCTGAYCTTNVGGY